MGRIERDDFSRHLSLQLTVKVDAPALSQQLDVRPADLRGIGDGDSVIRGEAEFKQLYDRLSELDKARPLPSGNVDRATTLYNLLIAKPDGASGSAPAKVDGVTRSSRPQVGISGSVRRTPGVDAPADKPTTPTAAPADKPVDIQARAQALRDLPLPKGDAHAPVAAYLDAMDRRGALAELKSSHARLTAADSARPKNVREDVWALSRSAEMQGVTAADARAYLATGQLPDQLDDKGNVTKTGAERFAALEKAASRDGGWPAVNTFSFLVGMRRSAMAGERNALEGAKAGLPESGRAELDAKIADSKTTDAALGRGLQGIYTAATYARERTGHALVGRGDRIERDAATLRAKGDTKGAERLDKRADETRTLAARMGQAEATYRAAMPGSGWDKASPLAVAAEAQIGRGRAEVSAMARRGGEPPATVPAALGHAADAGNGVAGAGALLDSAKKVHPAGDHRTLGLETARQGATAEFHKLHLDRGKYFERPNDRVPAPRSAALVAHREAYVDARAGQSAAIGRRLDLYGPTDKLKGPQALDAARLAGDRRQIVDELTESLATSMSSQRGVTGARTRAAEGHKALDEATKASAAAQGSVTRSQEGKTHAVDNDHAVVDMRDTGEARRDHEGVADATTTLDADQVSAKVAAARVTELQGAVGTADGQVTAAENVARRDAQDADIVRRALIAQPRAVGVKLSPTTTTDQAYAKARHEADKLAVASAGYLKRAEGDLPAKGSARVHAEREIAGHRLDTARYWTRSADVEVSARGDDGRKNAVLRLDTAAASVELADSTRLREAPGSPARLALAAAVIDVRSDLAEAYADYRPATSRGQLDAAEAVMNIDLAKNAPLAEHARGRIGAAATTSLLRHDARFDAVVRAGQHAPTADDGFYEQAHRMLDKGRGGASAPVVAAQKQLAEVDKNLDAVGDMLAISGDQLKAGQAYAKAMTRSMGRSEIQAAQAQVSVVISGGVWLASNGSVDMRGMMAKEGEAATRHRLDQGERLTRIHVHGQGQLSSAWDSARKEGRPFEMLGSIRVFSDRELGANKDPAVRGAYVDAFKMIDGHAPKDPAAPDRDSDWQDFNRAAIRQGEVPVARALAGSVIGFTGAREAMGDRRLGVITSDQREGMIDSQAKSLEATTKNMGWVIAANTGLEVGLGVVLTGGIGSAGAVAEAGNALNAGRVGLEAVEAARAASTMARAGQLLTAFRAAHPVINAVGVGTAVGAGMMGVSHGARHVFGASSGAARAVDVAANFIPIGAGHRAAGMAAERALITGGEHAGQASSGIKAAVSTERLIAHARFYGPQLALGSGQAMVASAATPALADKLGIRSEGGQAALGLALNALMTGGVAIGSARRGAAHSEAMTRHLTENAKLDAATAGKIRGDVEHFMKRTEGRMPTEFEVGALRTQLAEHLGKGQGAKVEAVVEAIRIDRATSMSLSEKSAPIEAVEATAQRLIESRGPEASRTQAYRDATESVLSRVESTPQARAALYDRVAAAEITSGFATAPSDGHPPLLTAAQRPKVEAILASEMGTLRSQLESTSGRPLTEGSPSAYQKLSSRLQTEAGLTPTAAESVLRGTQHSLVERTVVSRLVTAQESATQPLTVAQMEASARQTAEKAGVPKDQAAALAPEVVAKGGLVEWVQRRLPEKFWTPEHNRRDFESYAGPGGKAELSALSQAQFEAVFGKGPVPVEARAVVDLPGFGAFAAAHPAEARTLIDAAGAFPDRARKEIIAHGMTLNDGWKKAAADFKGQLPTIAEHPTLKNHVIVKRGPQSPSSMPEVTVRPTLAEDHNGAFHQPAFVPETSGTGLRRARTDAPELRVMNPDQLVVNGKPLASMNGVMVYAGHGSPSGISGHGPKAVAVNIADQIAAAPPGSIQHVVLDACHQRDAKWGFRDSNAQKVRTELNAELACRGLAPVTVLAADRAGPTYGPSASAIPGGGSQKGERPWHRDQNNKLHWGQGELSPTTWSDKDSARPFLSTGEVKAAAGVTLLVGAEAGAVFFFRAVSDARDKERQPVKPAAPRDPR